MDRWGKGRIETACLMLAAAMLCGCGSSLPPGGAADMNNAIAVRELLEAGSQGAASSAAALAEPTGWATLRGVFRVNGSPPSRASLTVDKDLAICAPGGRQVLDEQVVVDSNGGLANVLIYLDMETPADNPLWEHESYLAMREGEVEFDQKECVFLSHVFAMRSTQRLKILNSDPVGHNTNITPSRGANAFNQTIPANSSAYYEPRGESPAPFPVSCAIHPWMKSFMITRDNPYFAVTKADGSFEIANLPAGVELEFRVWQEKAKYVQEVSVGGESQKWSKGRFSLTLQPDQTENLEVAVPAAAFN